MSLLMDALRRAEEEKRRAAERAASPPVAPGDDAPPAQTDPITASPPVVGGTGAFTPHAPAVEALSLEPLPGELSSPRIAPARSAFTPMPEEDLDAPDPIQSGSTTIERALAALGLTAAGAGARDPEVTRESHRPREPGADATLPSERALRTSLREFFDSSQSVEGEDPKPDGTGPTLVRDAVSGPGRMPPGLTEATPQVVDLRTGQSQRVTAQAVLTAAHRRTSSQLYSLLVVGLFLVAAALGGVGFYYYAQSLPPPPRLPLAARSPTDPAGPPAPPTAPAAAGEGVTAPPALPQPPATGENARVSAPVVAPTLDPGDGVDVALDAGVGAEAGAAGAGPMPQPARSAAEPGAMAATTPAAAVVAPQARATAPAPSGPGEEAHASRAPPPEAPQAGVAGTAGTAEAAESAPLARVDTGVAASAPALTKAVAAPPFLSAEGAPIAAAVRISRSAPEAAIAPGLMQAFEAWRRGDLAAAERGYRTVLASRPTERDALLGLAGVAVARGQTREAVRLYQTVLRQDPRDSVASAGLHLLQRGDGPDLNVTTLQLMLDEEPAAAHLHFALGSHHARQQRWAEAQAAFFEAWRLEVDNPDYAFNLAVALDQLGQTRAAVEYYQRALRTAATSRRRPAFNRAAIEARLHTLQVASPP